LLHPNPDRRLSLAELMKLPAITNPEPNTSMIKSEGDDLNRSTKSSEKLPMFACV